VGRIDDKGNFNGTVFDYRTRDTSLLAKFTYELGILNGPATFYFSKGGFAVQGEFVRGQQSGDWKYWYPDGQPRQVLRFPLVGPVRILAYWDSTGRQLTKNGTGIWEGLTTSKLFARGSIRLGLPDGTWLGQHTQSHVLVTTELYDKGSFRHGRLMKPQADQHAVYKFFALLTPFEPSSFLRADYMVLGYNCDESKRRSQFQLIKTQLQLPSVKIGVTRYADRLSQRLSRYRSTHWYNSMPSEVTVLCFLDQQGQFTDFESETSSLLEVIRTLISSFPSWQPARYQSQPILGHLSITLNTVTGRVILKPAAHLPPSQLPDPDLDLFP
jgi:hypothetical protein